MVYIIFYKNFLVVAIFGMLWAPSPTGLLQKKAAVILMRCRNEGFENKW